MRKFALVALFGLAACHHQQADQPNPGADAQAQTAAKTIADLQAADSAAQGAPPEIAPARPPHEDKVKPVEKVDTPADSNDEDTVETNAD